MANDPQQLNRLTAKKKQYELIRDKMLSLDKIVICMTTQQGAPIDISFVGLETEEFPPMSTFNAITNDFKDNFINELDNAIAATQVEIDALAC